MHEYTFGDDRSALDRLRLVAEAYEPVSRAFLTANAPRTAQSAIDLGCGPGFSTRLLYDVCHPETLIGIDASGAFIEAAREQLPGVRFETHDVSTIPWPGAPVDLIYARLVLAHLPHPVALARRWLRQLHPGGRLLIEDLESVIDPPGPLRDYETVSAQVVRSGGGVMYAGAALCELGGESQRVTVPGALAAQIYLFNVRRWGGTPRPPVAGDRLRALEAGLIEVAADDRGTTVSWVVRQLSLRA